MYGHGSIAPDEVDRSWAIYANAAGLLIFTSIPFANVVAAVFIWFKVRNDARMPFARAHAATAVNFQLTWTLFTACFTGLLVALAFKGHVAILPMFVAGYIALALLNVIFSIMGCARASDAKGYHYPLSIRFVR